MAANQNTGAEPQSPPSPGKTSLQNSAPVVLRLKPLPGIQPFVPAAGLCGGHRQTLVGLLLQGFSNFFGTVLRKVLMPDDDYIVLHDDQPGDWKPGQQIVLMLHGLSGCHGSGYMVRVAHKLNELGIRSFRMDHRGCGAGKGLAVKPYHAGRVNDLSCAITFIEKLCPKSPISVVGFSLSGNLLLRYLGDRSLDHSPNLFRAVAICPPVDLGLCVKQLDKTRAGQCYNHYFTRRLISQIANGPQWRDDLPLANAKQLPRRLSDFDDMYTAPASGFRSADDYYQFASAHQYLNTIDVPTTILAARDDPVVSPKPFCHPALPSTVTLYLTEHGGHLGYFSRRGNDPDRRWMDWRVIDWLSN